MRVIEDLQETWESLDWFQKLVLLVVVIVVIGEWQGWWNDTGLIALNLAIIGMLTWQQRHLAKIEETLRRIELNTRD